MGVEPEVVGGAGEQPEPVPIVSGTVTEQGSGTPLEGASVSVFHSGGQWRNKDLSDVNGDYLIDANLPEGSARVKCELAGYVTQNTWVTLTAGLTEVVDFQVEPVPAQSPIVSGTVTVSGSGTPLEGASVSVFDSGGQWLNTDTTDVNGDYTISQSLSEGLHRVKCELAGYVTQNTWVTLSVGTNDVDFQMEPEPVPIVSGTVTEQGSGTPLQGASVSVFDSGGQWRNKDTTDVNGDYLIDSNLPEGSARVKCELAGYVTQNTWVTLTAGVTTDVDFQLVAEQVPIVSGTVTEQGSGTPLQGASVSVFDSGGQWRNKDTTDVNGDYLIDTNLPEGSARVKCELAGYVTQNTWVTLTAGVTTDVDFQLEPVAAQSPIVSGTVTEQGSGTPLEGASVSVFDSGGQWRNKDTTDVNGDYLIDANLPEGSARVKCELAGYVTQNTWVTLTAGLTEVVDFQLVPE